MSKLPIIILTLVLAMAMGLASCTHASPPATARAIERPPTPPSNLSPQAISYDTVKLQWIDNSDNEHGFRIYRDNNLIEIVVSNLTTYQDIGLKPGTTYRYTVKAYNAIGESQAVSASIKTLNPPIMVRLDRIGVYHNGEHWLRGQGEIYVGIVVSDGNNIKEQRLPRQKDRYYLLEKNETVPVGEIVFSVDEVGDYLMVSVIGYESDGGAFEMMFYKALGAAAQGYLTGGSGSFLEMFDYSLGGLIATLFGAEDDWLGSYERTWDQSGNWGVGNYVDIPLEGEGGVQCLRLWFTITIP